MRIGSLYAGIGGLDLAVESVTGGRVVWQLDQVGADVRRRHWPEALQVEANVAGVDPTDLPDVDVICAGFSCRDLSVAGLGAGLSGQHTGPTYRGLLRFVRALRPRLVAAENVPRLLTCYQRTLERDFRGLGYGLTWIKARALDAGAPHRRARVFVVARRQHLGGGIVQVSRDGAWRGDAARPWPTPTAAAASGNGSRSMPGSRAHPGTSLTDAVRADRSVAGGRPWPTPTARDYKTGQMPGRSGGPTLGVAVTWATPSAANPNEREPVDSWTARRDAQRARRINGNGISPPLGMQVALGRRNGEPGRRLNPDWVETLMGMPVGWTLPTGPSLRGDADELLRVPTWPRGWWGPAGTWWPGYDWEPPRTLPDGPPVRGRPARLRALGNAVVPQQGILALKVVLS